MRLVFVVLPLVCFLSFASIKATKLKGVQVSPDEFQSAPLLTPSYGIVSETDRRKDLRARIPFLPAPGINYFYWQCLKLEKVRFTCGGEHRAESGTGCRWNICLPEMTVISEGREYVFLTHQLWCVESYRDLKATWRRLLRHEKIACFGAEYIAIDPGNEEYTGETEDAWFVMRIRTRHGTWDYFED